MKQVILKSGATGSQYKLRSSYSNFEEFESYCENYSIHTRLGYKTPATAWQKNPLVEGGTNPSDFRKVTKRIIEQRKKRKNEKAKSR